MIFLSIVDVDRHLCDKFLMLLIPLFICLQLHQCQRVLQRNGCVRIPLCVWRTASSVMVIQTVPMVLMKVSVVC